MEPWYHWETLLAATWIYILFSEIETKIPKQSLPEWPPQGLHIFLCQLESWLPTLQHHWLKSCCNRLGGSLKSEKLGRVNENEPELEVWSVPCMSINFSATGKRNMKGWFSNTLFSKQVLENTLTLQGSQIKHFINFWQFLQEEEQLLMDFSL